MPLNPLGLHPMPNAPDTTETRAEIARHKSPVVG
jgi:hypothetical protein